MTYNAAMHAEAAARAFAIDGDLVAATPYGSGHINDSFRVIFEGRGASTPLLMQRINHRIFKEPRSLMDNIRRVTVHLASKLAPRADGARRVLTLVPTRKGDVLHVDANGDFWRAYLFVEPTSTFNSVRTAEQAFEAGKAFGEFQSMLADLPAPRLHDTIPNFHYTPGRFAALEQAIAADVAGRAASCAREIEFALARKPLTTALLDAGLPERVTHNDTKINNLLFDSTGKQAVCVIDLDTVMPGLAGYDFGDLVRTATSPAAEDERDLAQVEMQFPLFEALCRGYLSTAGAFLTRDERLLLPISGHLITFEIAIRFLTDHLAGDTYFKVHREGHNLDRCRAQFKLLASLERQQRATENLVVSLS